MSTLEDRIRGSLLGLAWGDVFGCPVEGWRAHQIQEVYGVYNQLPTDYPFDRIVPLGRKALKRLRPLGLHSDDTQQALALVNVCLEPPSWSRERWAAWLVEGKRRRAWRGYGRNFTTALQNLSRGVRPEQSGSPSAGIGAVMRIGPLGALYRDDPEQLGQVVFESSLMTHGDLRSGAVAYAVAFTVAAFLEGRTPEEIRTLLPAAVAVQERRWLQGHADWTIKRSAGQVVSQSLTQLFAEPLNDAARLRERVSAMARPHLPPQMTVAHPNQGFVLLGGLHALGLALSSAAEPMPVLAELVGQGYDTDTVAAICGTMFGARFGSGWIPVERFVDRQRLEAYAEALIGRVGPPEDRQAFFHREAELTRQEDEYQTAILARWVT